MDINQELERLHKSFQINQECNSGDAAGELIRLIDTVYCEVFNQRPSLDMDLSLKNEMTKFVCKDDGTHDDHGFEISEEIRPTFELFKRFLEDNFVKGEYFYLTGSKDKDFFNRSNAKNWVVSAFIYPDYSWATIRIKWNETLAQIDEVKTQLTSRDDDHGFNISEELQPTFDKFKQFLKDNDAGAYWNYFEEDKNFFKSWIKFAWVSEAFTFSKSPQGSDFWYKISSKWNESLK